MAHDFGDTLSTATPLSLNRVKPFSNKIGGDDRRDYLKISLSTHSSVNATLSKFKGNLRLALLNESGTVLQTASTSGKKKLINTILGAGNYFFRLIGSRTDTTNYRFKVNSAAPGNTDPTVATNTGVGLSRGGFANLNSSLLKTIDAQQSASQLVYTLTGKPTAGQLKLNGNLLGVGSTFTQADIEAGRVSYLSRNSVTQLTQNTFEDGGEGFFALSSEEAIVWSGYDGTDTEIYRFDGNTTTPLTNNNTTDFVTGISGNKVVWYGKGGTDGGTDYEIFYYDGSTTRQLTTNDTQDLNPQISGSNIGWYGAGGSDGGADYEVFYYNGNTTQQLTANDTQDFGPEISGSRLTWQGQGGSDGGSDFEVFFYNGITTQQLTTNSTEDYNPQISESNLVWRGAGGSDGGSDFEIFFYNGTSTRQLTTNNKEENYQFVSGSNVVWTGAGGSDGGTDHEVFYYNGSSTQQLTTNSVSEYEPQVSGSNVIWYGAGGTDGGTDDEIFFYNGSIRQLTQNNVSEFYVGVAGDLYVWPGPGGADGGSDYEIFYGSYVTSDRFSFTVSDGAGGSTAGSFVFNIT